ncbi:MAG: GAF domain-containing protein [Patescibacteria group bacterium]
MTASSRTKKIVRSGYGFEAAGWFLTLLLGSLIVFLPQAGVPGRQARLILSVALLAVANVVFQRLMPESSEGPIRFVKEDKALVVSLAMVVLLTGFIYVLPEMAGTLGYLYFIPLFASALVLHENVVLAESAFSLLAMLFLHAAAWVRGPFMSWEFTLQLLIFAAASACLVSVTRGLRQAFEKTDRLSRDLSDRLDQLQVINMLVRLSEFTSELDRLASRAGGIVSDAIDAERHAVFVLEGDSKELRRVGEGADADFYARDLMSVEENMSILRGIIETGIPRVFDGKAGGIERFVGNARIRDMLVMPLHVRDASIGVLCLVNRRKGQYDEEDVNYCELLTGFMATLLNAALLFRKTLTERDAVERMARLMVGREVRMKELKELLSKRQGP